MPLQISPESVPQQNICTQIPFAGSDPRKSAVRHDTKPIFQKHSSDHAMPYIEVIK